MSKNQTEFLNRQRATLHKAYLRKCQICGIEILMCKNQKYCSAKCKGKVQYINRKQSTENQYEKISGNWERYLHRLLYSGGRKRDGLTVDILLAQLKKQDYKCALSGDLLTCNLEIGTISKTNASIDRLIPGGLYTADNIQLVCRALNGFRTNTSVDEFIAWCQKVTEWQQYKNT